MALTCGSCCTQDGGDLPPLLYLARSKRSLDPLRGKGGHSTSSLSFPVLILVASQQQSPVLFSHLPSELQAAMEAPCGCCAQIFPVVRTSFRALQSTTRGSKGTSSEDNPISLL